jgi:CheY-like chemotaxis protein
VGVLIVDDTPDVREMYADYLTAAGCRVATAHDGEAGVVAATHSPPDVIVMDLAMPRMDGVTAVKKLRSSDSTRDVPVIVLTGYPLNAIDKGVLEAGADVLLTKPCLPEDLDAHVRRLFGEGRARKPA